MSGDLASDLDVEELRRSGRWALYWELLHARGSGEAISEAWATISEAERPSAQAGLDAVRKARHERLRSGARERARSRIGDEPDYVVDARSAAIRTARASDNGDP